MNLDTKTHSNDYNDRHVYAGLPAKDRPNSEVQEPHAPIAKTREGYRSVLVAKITDEAFIRISPSGFRLITLNRRKDGFTIQGAPGIGELRGLANIETIAHMVESSSLLRDAMPAKVTPEAIREAGKGIPQSVAAWYVVAGHEFNVSWLDDTVKDALRRSRGY